MKKGNVVITMRFGTDNAQVVAISAMAADTTGGGWFVQVKTKDGKKHSGVLEPPRKPAHVSSINPPFYLKVQVGEKLLDVDDIVEFDVP
jgi:hypothetical protein